MTSFFRSVSGTYNPEIDHDPGPTRLEIPGSVVQVKGDPERYRALGLIESAAPTFLFTPDEYGLRSFTEDFVQVGDQVTWNDRVFTVRDVQTIAPDGIVIAARIVAEA